MSKTILIVAFDFPPSSSAAVQRTLKLADYLKDFGWQAVILTAKVNAYEQIENSQPIPEHLIEHVYRTGALDVHNHLSIHGKHFNWMKAIDRWSTWIPGAILCGKNLLKKYQFDAILSTAPIPSAHIIAGRLAAQNKIPWLADYQDPMAYLYESTSKLRTYCHHKIDKYVTTNASALVFATRQAMQLYQRAFPKVERSKFFFVENGFNESNFEYLEKNPLHNIPPFNNNKFSLYYSGILYPHGRDPNPLFKAVNLLIKSNKIKEADFEIIFQGAGTGEKFNPLINSLGIQKMIKFLPPVPYIESLHNMQNADALILIQDSVFNLQVPGKLYEYIRSDKPILAITPNESATAEVANRVQNSFVASEVTEIANKINKIIELPNADFSNKKTNDKRIESFSRYSKTKEFSKILDGIINEY